MNSKTLAQFAAALAVALILSVSLVQGQVGKSQGIIDPNVAAEKELLALPHMTPAIVKSLMEKRPFAGITVAGTACWVGFKSSCYCCSCSRAAW